MPQILKHFWILNQNITIVIDGHFEIDLPSVFAKKYHGNFLKKYSAKPRQTAYLCVSHYGTCLERPKMNRFQSDQILQ